MLDSLLSPLPATKEYVDTGTRPDESYTANDGTTAIDTDTTPHIIYLNGSGAKKEILNFSIPTVGGVSRVIQIVTEAASYTLQINGFDSGTFGPGTTTLFIRGGGTFNVSHVDLGQYATVNTTDNTITEIDRITIPTDSIILVEVKIVGKRTNSVNQLAGGTMRAQARNDAGIVSFSTDLGTTYSNTGTTIGGDDGVINPTDSPSFSISGGDLVVNVKGGSGGVGWDVTWNSIITYKPFDFVTAP